MPAPARVALPANPFVDATAYGMLQAVARRHGGREALVFGDARLRISHFMVAPGEIEAFLMSHPDVEQAFVVGVPDARTNEAAVAYVTTKEGSPVTEEALQQYCRGKIASYKIPRGLKFVKDVPRTPGPHGDKVRRGKLKEHTRHDFPD